MPKQLALTMTPESLGNQGLFRQQGNSTPESPHDMQFPACRQTAAQELQQADFTSNVPLDENRRLYDFLK
jgi:hypothetical protein